MAELNREQIIRVLKRMPEQNKNLNGVEQAAIEGAVFLLQTLRLEIDRQTRLHIENLEKRLQKAHTQNAILRGQQKFLPKGKHAKRD